MSLIPATKRIGDSNDEGSDEQHPSKIMKNEIDEICFYGPRRQMSIYGPEFKYGPNRRVFKKKPYLTPDSDEDDIEESDNDKKASEHDEKQGTGTDEVKAEDKKEEAVEDEEEVKNEQEMEDEDALNKEADEWLQEFLNEFDQD